MSRPNPDPPSASAEIAAMRQARAALEGADIGFCVFRVLYDANDEPCDYVFLDANPAFERHTGIQNAIGRPVMELVPGLELEWPRRYSKVARTGNPATFTMGSATMGREFHVHAMPSGVPGSEEVAVFFSDVTARRRAEADAEAANERTRQILEAMTDAYASVDREWRFLAINRRAEELLGRTAEDLIGRIIWDEFPGLRGSPFEVLYRRAAEGEGGSLTAYYPDHRRHYEVQARPTPEGIVAYFRDVSATVAAREEREGLLRQVEAERRKFRQLSDASSSYVAVLRGPDLTFEYTNDENRRLAARPIIEGRTFAETYPELAGGPYEAMLRSVILTGEPVFIPESPVVLTDSDGRTRTLAISLRMDPLTESDGTTSGVFAHGVDLTEAVRARRDLAARAEETASGSRRKDEFLATLAHELRNPLAPIRLSTELLGLLEPEEPEFDEARAVIARQVDHMARLVDDLLDVSRVARGKIELKEEIVELADVATAAIETSRPVISAAGHTFATRFADEPVRVRGDRTRLAQVLANLLNNAARYTPAGGNIELEVGREGNEAFVRVRDDGAGIAPEMIETIFEMFAQGDVRLSESRGGLGIGLTLARTLVELHGGRLEARSDGAGLGSEFVVHLPVAVGVASEAEPLPACPEATSPLKVLVVDDNEDGAVTLARLAEKMGHETRVAHTGEDALRAAAEFRPDVVLLDVGLPDLSGYEIARRLRADERFGRTRLVAQTGWGRTEDRAAGIAAGFDAHLIKPLTRESLVRALSGPAA